MKYIKIITTIFLIICSQISVAQSLQDSLKIATEKLSKGLKEKNTSIIKEVLADNFAIGTRSWPASESLLDLIFQNVDFQSAELITKDIKNSNDTIFTTIKFQTSKKAEESVIAFSNDYKILFIDYFDRLYGQSRYRESKLKGKIPFRLIDKSIVLTIKLNNNTQPLLFLLDTGADGMAIRKSLADSLNLKTNHTQNANIVGGQRQVSISSGNTVYISDSISLKNQNIAIFENIKNGVDGIIGLNLVNQYIFDINFDKEQIALYTYGNYKYEGKGEMIDITVPNKLIIMPASLNIVGKKSVNGNFILDTGANYHLIAFSRFVRKNRLLLTGFKPESSGSTVSLGHATPVYSGKAFEFRLNDNIVLNDMPVTLQASTGSDNTNRTEPDGSIGIQFFYNYNFTIDLLRKQIYLTPR